MDDAIVVHIFQTDKDASDEEFGLCFSEPFALVLMVSEIAACNQIGDQEDILIVSERIEHVDQKSRGKQESDPD